MTLKWDDIKGHLPADKRREIEARAGKKPSRPRPRSRRREPVGAPPPAAPKMELAQEDFRLRKCPWCKSEVMGPPEVVCPIECKGSRSVRPGRGTAGTEERDGGRS